MAEHVTRLAPSPTGALHLGNARTFLVNYLLARREGWRVLMRVEDLDGPRIKAGAAGRMLDELAWLGLRWDEPIVYQSQRAEVYRAALTKLAEAGWAYPCTCSRRDVLQAAGAPHEEDSVANYPGTCLGRYADADEARAATGREPAWRVRVEPGDVTVSDRFAGVRRLDPGKTGGDFVIFRNEGMAGYQLAVVLDDAEAGVDRIVRGDDLLDSAARQIHIRRLLDLGPEPRYWHLPLVVGPDGRRLAKRHGDTRLAHYRQRGATPERVLGLLGYTCGLLDRRRDAEMDELIERFDLSLLGSGPTVLTPQDDAFLLG